MMNIEEEDIIMGNNYNSDYETATNYNLGVRNKEPAAAMTLEDFLTKATGAVVSEDVVINAPPPLPMMMMMYPPAAPGIPSGVAEGKCKAEATEHKKKKQMIRMIKNRESAARSRDRKQAYTMELEALIAQLEAENATLLYQQAQMYKERHEQLMKKLVPVVEKRRAPRVLKRVHSTEW